MDRGRLERAVPGIRVARTYERSWLGPDLLAGVVVTSLLIPAGMGYAEAAGLPPETGLYATIVPLLVYALVGPSRTLVLGPDSSLAPIIAAAVVPLAQGDPQRAVALAGLLAILMGAVLLVGSFARLGFVTDLLSKPIRIGYLNGVALVIIVGQSSKLLGFDTGSDSFLPTLGSTIEGIADGLVDPTAALIGVGSLVLILGFRLARSRFPALVLAVVASMVLVAVLGWSDRVPVVGALPEGLPAPALGGLRWSDVLELIGPAAGIALIAFTDTAVLSRSLAARRGESVDGNQEMAAIGLASGAAGLLGGFPVSASSSRTPVAEQAGAHSQLVGVVGAVLVAAFILFAPGATAYLPSATLAAVVIVAGSSLMDLPAMWKLGRAEVVEGLLSVAAFAGVALVGVLEGILIAIGLSFAALVYNASRPYRTELVRIRGRRGYHDATRHPEGEPVPGVVIVRFDAPLFFANAPLLDREVHRAVAERSEEDPVSTLVLSAEPITSVDSTAVDTLVDLDDYLASRGIRLLIAEMKGPVKDQLSAYGLGERFGPERFYSTVGAAVDELTGTLRYDIQLPDHDDDSALEGGQGDDDPGGQGGDRAR